MEDALIQGNYEYETGRQIISCFDTRKLDYRAVEMILIGNHAPFTWGKSADKAVYNSAVLETIAEMAWLTEQINPNAPRLKEMLVRKHYERKHGPSAYYGQQPEA
jgi:L-ribulose-5-phosphate 4-epimerase